ncbi:uncharacterized protein LOC105421402 [Amborella trichopoda]|uniref:uncharacterized protein LOC105421402 n=1 Tax=Amborella trichopoda TaxID=13333 RepID=UPI0005D3740E|nr:uncharacterized protein LOC105421402 [Amborella trichopoda]|eukprot:XP_011627006.1 uncharacterized protein LOC105421402 [Amborella trichopoda]
MWEVWKERNRRTFEGTVLNLDKVIHLVELSIWSSISVSKEGYIKLNFDESSIGNPSPIGIGGAFQDSDGDVLLSFAGPIGVATANSTELLAVLKGLEIFRDRYLGAIFLVEGDYFNVIRWCRKEQLVPWELRSPWLKILDISSSISVSFSHIYRETNGIADMLAKVVCRLLLFVLPMM